MRHSNGLHLPKETFCCLSLGSCWKHSLPGRFECLLLWYREWEGETTPVSATEFSTTMGDIGTAQTQEKTSELAVQETKVNSLSHFIHWIPCRAIKPSVPVSYACVCTCAHMPAVWAVPGKRLDTGRAWPRQCPPTVGVKWVQGAGCKVSTEGSDVQWRGCQSHGSPGKTRSHPISCSSSLSIWVIFLNVCL